MKKNLIIAGLFFVLLDAEVPRWFLKPSLDSSKLYGFGTGDTLISSKQNAIIDLANSLQSSVQTSFEQLLSNISSFFK